MVIGVGGVYFRIGISYVVPPMKGWGMKISLIENPWFRYESRPVRSAVFSALQAVL